MKKSYLKIFVEINCLFPFNERWSIYYSQKNGEIKCLWRESIRKTIRLMEIVFSFFSFFRYLPPYTSFIPIKPELEKNPEEFEKKKKRRIVENLIFSQLTYLVMFIILICITERKKLKDDPLNFNVLNITVEVIRYFFFNLLFISFIKVPYLHKCISA